MIIKGLKLVKTCSAYPEQYDVYDSDNNQVGYLRLRYGRFTAEYPHCGGKILYSSNTIGDGVFCDSERDVELKEAIKCIIREMDMNRKNVNGNITYYTNEKGDLHNEDGPAYIKRDNSLTIVKWYNNGQLHRIGGPAITLYESNNIIKEEWYFNNMRHRDDGPAVMNYEVFLYEWYQFGKRHRDNDLPAVVSNDTKNEYHMWYSNGELHRIGGPAIKYSDGSEDWYVNGKKHRIDGPATTYVGTDGKKEYYYFVDGELHRVGGPAIVSPYIDDRESCYFIHGNQI